jgi:hypothetical protein
MVLTISRTLAACLGIWRRLLILSGSISLHVCNVIFEMLEDGRIYAPELSCIVSSDGEARELLWMLNQPLEDGLTFATQPLVVKQYVELCGFGEIGELVKRGIKADFGAYGLRERTPDWAAGVKPEGQRVNLWPARARDFKKSCLWEVDGGRTERYGARNDIISIILQDEGLRIIGALEEDVRLQT